MGMSSPIKIFCCYANKDRVLLNSLKIHLMSLQRQNLVTTWADTDISPGANWEQEISKHINTAQIILLLVSPDFLASDYCYSKEMAQALERDKRGDACVIPIILRPVYWQETPFHKLQALPKNAKPLKKWSNIDDGFLSVVEGIRLAIKNLPQQPSVNTSPQPTTNRTAMQPKPSIPQQPSISTFSVPAADQLIQRPTLSTPQQPLANAFSPLPTNSSHTQQQPISYVKKANVTNLSGRTPLSGEKVRRA